MLDAALLYHGTGYRVIPVNRDKSPACLQFKHWFTQPQTEDEIRRLFSHSVYGLARLLYPASSDVVLDFDGPHADDAWGPLGVALPDTARVFTPKGHHLGLRVPPDIGNGLNIKRQIRLVEANCECRSPEGKRKLCGVDLLLNGYAIAPPTPGYREDPDWPLEDAAVIPDALIELARTASSNGRGNSRQSDYNEGDRILEGRRNSTLSSLAGTMRRRGMTEEEILADLQHT